MFRFPLYVNGDGIRARFKKARQIMIGPLDHEMNVERQLGVFAHGRDDRGTEGNVIDEMSVHDVAMDPICACGFDAMDFVTESREIGGKNGRSNDDSFHRSN